MKYALLSPRDEKGSNKKRRQRASANASSASATETTDANGKVANPYAQMYSMTNKEAAAAAAAAEAAAAAAAANRLTGTAQAPEQCDLGRQPRRAEPRSGLPERTKGGRRGCCR